MNFNKASRRLGALGVLGTFTVLTPISVAQEVDDLADLSLDELLSIEVTSVAKKPQSPDEAASAIFVITDDDLRKSGVSTIADALRLAPGVEVTEVDQRITGVAIRGFNWHFSNKILVLVDGREVFQPSMTGIFWDQQVTPLEDIQRIEVVRGPGAVIWGGGAVNGVINIVTKHAVDSMGSLVRIEAGTDGDVGFHVRQGTTIGETGAVRIYATGRNIPSLETVTGENLTDDGQIGQVGFRLDLEPSDRDAFTFQADYQELDTESIVGSFVYANSLGGEGEARLELLEDDGEHFNVLGRWVREVSDTNVLTLQGYYNFQERSDFGTKMTAKTLSVEASQFVKATDWADIVWGLTWRRSEDESVASRGYSFAPDEFSGEWMSGYAQAEFEPLPDTWRIILGARAEKTPYTDWEFQPSLRTIWLGDDDWSVWGAVSRAVRSPTRIETSLNAAIDTVEPFSEYNPSPLPVDIYLRSYPDYAAEDLIAYEAGFRKGWDDGSSLDIALYQHAYEKLVSLQGEPPEILYAEVAPGIQAPVRVNWIYSMVNSDLGNRTTGVEVAYERDLTNWWSASLTGDWRDFDLKYDRVNPNDPDDVVSYGDWPNWQVSLRNDFELGPDLDASVWVRHVSELDLGSAESYTDLDVRLSWQATDHAEFSLIGRNLIEPSRNEMVVTIHPSPSQYVPRSVMARASFRF